MPPPKVIEPKLVKLIKEYRVQNPLLSKQSLAKLIVKNENTIYKNAKAFGDIISVVENQPIPVSFEPDVIEFDIPNSLYEEYIPHILPASANNILIINDVHIPFHDKNALLLALKHGKERDVNTIIVNGDLIDLYSQSRFNRLPKFRNTKVEIGYTKQFLTMLREKFPHAVIVYKEGNHELRLKDFLMRNAPELYEIDEIKLDELLGLKKLRIDWIEDKRLIKVGKLFVIHGHEIFSGAGAINVARIIRLKTNENVIFGHFHKSQEDFQTSISGKTIGSWSVGCLCGLNPQYAPINQWNSGFAVVEVDKDETFDVDNKLIVNGKVK